MVPCPDFHERSPFGPGASIGGRVPKGFKVKACGPRTGWPRANICALKGQLKKPGAAPRAPWMNGHFRPEGAG